MSIDKLKNKSLREAAHHLNPIIWVGKNGITKNVIKEIIQALEHHELIKIKLLQADKEQRKIDIEKICKFTGTQLINNVGNILIIYKENNQKS